jgi:two-component system sensor histidine kinase DegS
MSNTTPLEAFVAEAANILLETEGTLRRLAHEALLKSGTSEENGLGDQALLHRLQQIGQQLSKLSQRSKALQLYLQNGLEAPPADDDAWPLVRVLQSQEEERTQLARELEDSIGQLLANAIFELASCQQLLTHDLEAVAQGLVGLQEELEQGLANIRYFITDLEPATILGNFGLGGGVRRYLEQFEARTNIKTELRINTNLGRLPSIIEVTIFRVIQEALSNVRRHAKATQVEVIFQEKDNMLEFTIIDNGEGLTSDRVDMSRKNLGLARMVDYAELLKGRLRVFSDLQKGTQVTLSVPYEIL